ncbi:hypothetical protein DNK59_11125 [Pseudomonas sp. TKO26]|nr:hypothetical protein DNK62_11125 [Pseudomonas sp. TKO30]PYY89943.1 hypothetical protein DNK61_11120 [Pseudomonas sp. TKO29]PYY93030.1 hypothetical protein DNK59_11125 [Pseudomonas sp. TKO26]PYZ00160.1 hypothetical protein DNK60_11120 [Pseudomonas sp. TKO14]
MLLSPAGARKSGANCSPFNSQLFLQQGSDCLSKDAIVATAQGSKAMVYRNFDSKKALAGLAGALCGSAGRWMLSHPTGPLLFHFVETISLT